MFTDPCSVRVYHKLPEHQLISDLKGNSDQILRH